MLGHVRAGNERHDACRNQRPESGSQPFRQVLGQVGKTEAEKGCRFYGVGQRIPLGRQRHYSGR